MNRTETLALTRYVQALCPAQKLDEFSADAWHDVLADLPHPVAKKAAAMCARSKPFVAPSEIVTAAHRLRRAVRSQIEREVDGSIDSAPTDGRGYVEWRREQVAWAIAEADRRLADDVYDVTGVDVAGAIDPDDYKPLTRRDGRPAIEARKPEPPADPERTAEVIKATIRAARSAALSTKEQQ